MELKEKVINGLEHEINRTDLEWLDCVEVSLLREALELIKAQEPRLVVKQDFNNSQIVDEYGYMPVWREEKESHELVCECVIVGCVDPELEGDKWPYRYWTVKPSKELMEATLWEERENGEKAE